MAQKVHIVLVDDLDGSDGTQTVSFGLDGTSYEIDLSDENAAKLRDALAPYVAHGRKVTGSRGGRRRSGGGGGAAKAAGGSATPAEIREWARGQGMDVPERGRVSADVRAAYEAAH